MIKKTFLLQGIICFFPCHLTIQYASDFLPGNTIMENITRADGTLYCMQVGKYKALPKKNTLDKGSLIIENCPLKFFFMKDQTHEQISYLKKTRMEKEHAPFTVMISLLGERALKDNYHADENQEYTSLYLYNFKTAVSSRGKGYGEILFLEIISKNFLENTIPITFYSKHEAINFYLKRGAEKVYEGHEPKMFITRNNFLNFFRSKKEIIINNPHMKFTKLLLERENIPYVVNESDNTIEKNSKNADFSSFTPYNYALDIKNEKFKKNFNRAFLSTVFLGFMIALCKKNMH